MIGQRVVPLLGLAFILSTGLGLGVIVARSPFTHDNIRTAPTIAYRSTPLDTMHEADLESILADLKALPPSAYAVSHAGSAGEGTHTPAATSPATAPPQAPAAAVGKGIFMQRCTSCHSIGGGRRVGPDLRGVTSQKPREWLVAFITRPDEMIARGDPLATQLVKAYGVPMPNLGLSPVQAEAVLAHIEAETATLSPASEQAAGAMPGKATFEQKCAGCHTIGGGKLVGPDLKGVSARRTHDWIVEFIVAPDRVIANGDATATQLVREYGMPMPNLGLSRDQAEEVLGYIQSQDGGSPAQ